MPGFNNFTKRDGVTDSTQVISHEHHEIHNGDHFNVCNYQLGNAVDATIEFVFITDSSKNQYHLTFDVYSNLGALIDVYVNTSGVIEGTPITIYNNNTSSSNASGATFIKDPTSITDDGIKVQGFLAGAGRNAGIAKREREVILSPNSTYLFRITSLANSNNISWCAEWYEHSPKQ